jgi:hypothetical protein
LSASIGQVNPTPGGIVELVFAMFFLVTVCQLRTLMRKRFHISVGGRMMMMMIIIIIVVVIIIIMIAIIIIIIMTLFYIRQGDQMSDCCVSFCCSCCAVSQMARHLFHYQGVCSDMVLGPDGEHIV